MPLSQKVRIDPNASPEFVECGSFADYRDDPFSRFMQQSLN
jgi:hypothetical protein